MPKFRWFVGGHELKGVETRMTSSAEEDDYAGQEGQDDLTSISTALMAFTPKAEDNGKYLACKASNPHFPGRDKEDGYIINVRCESS